MKFIEKNRRNILQLRILDQLPQQNSLGHETNARFL